MSHCVFVRFCPGLNETFPAGELDNVSAAGLPAALEQVAQRWLDAHPGAEAEHQKRILERLKEQSKRRLGPPRSRGRRETAEEARRRRWHLGTDPEMPLFLRVARVAGWGAPEPQYFLGDEPVSVRFAVSREPDGEKAETAVAVLRRWLPPDKNLRDSMQLLGAHFGHCPEVEMGADELRESEIAIGGGEHPLGDLLRNIAGFLAGSRGGTDANAGETGDEDIPLSERQKRVLKVLWNESAFDSDHSLVADVIAVKALGEGADANQFKAAVADLKRHGYVDMKEGRGCWLTTAGGDRAEKL